MAEAREKVVELSADLRKGIDPIDAKRAKHAAALGETAKAMTFDQCAAAYIAATARVGAMQFMRRNGKALSRLMPRL